MCWEVLPIPLHYSSPHHHLPTQMQTLFKMVTPKKSARFVHAYFVWHKDPGSNHHVIVIIKIHQFVCSPWLLSQVVQRQQYLSRSVSTDKLWPNAPFLPSKPSVWVQQPSVFLVSHLIMCQPFRCPLLNPRSAVTISWVWWKKDTTFLKAMQMPSSKNPDIWFLIEQIFNSF